MKNIFFLLILALLTNCNLGYASAKELFAYDKQEIKQSLNDIDQLEKYVIENNATSLNDLQALPQFTQVAKSLKSNPLSPQFSLEEMDWGSFAWGFCCWPIGFFVVILNGSKDNNDKISYLIGLVTAFVVFGGGAWFGRGGGYYY